MGIDTGGTKGGPKSDINVTPLVDIVLVLLIIFLVTTPIMMHQITIEVPRKLTGEEDPTIASKQITVLVCFNGRAIISDGRDMNIPVAPVEPPLWRWDNLHKQLEKVLDEKKTEKVVFVDFEDDVPYGEAVSAMDAISQHKYNPSGSCMPGLATAIGKDVGAEKVALKVRDESEPVARTPDGARRDPRCTAKEAPPGQ
jgi:biopolymer transport protein ExbD